jgi:hypothetical protein
MDRFEAGLIARADLAETPELSAFAREYAPHRAPEKGLVADYCVLRQRLGKKVTGLGMQLRCNLFSDTSSIVMPGLVPGIHVGQLA